ncbi:lysozyme inhibitor LprI family protein [Allopontixanthobacter sp.]|uniref:lysozyme inhibitor LprI family protein n=1 Tax=Allopontixanthobacter sp. TaxID=2906452 RepID=UPI002AB962D9|nr:lysozyme inhibitor LprI family protein [Allopontixanthobacter sp.]MDZ4308695.1 lysozyme inhibitor LprI family protein [Allopontixanthobacter sp.]
MIALLPLLLLAGEPETDCDNPIMQAEMNFCAYQDSEAADAELNAQWQLTAATMKLRDENLDLTHDNREGFFDTLLKAQRAWIAYRDAHCMSEGYFARGGSMEPMLFSRCLTRLTIERTEKLRQLAKDYEEILP